jgi:hypothetical protein
MVAKDKKDQAWPFLFSCLLVLSLVFFALGILLTSHFYNASFETPSNSGFNNVVFQQPSSGSASSTITVPFTTSYSGVFSSSESSTPEGQIYKESPVLQVANQNQQEALKFLTCENVPSDPTSNVLFYSGIVPFVAGAPCLNTQGSLVSQLTLVTTVTWSQSSLAQASVGPLQVGNPGNAEVKNIAYTPMVDGELSNGFATNTYIFNGVPSFAQNDIWTWSATFANFEGANARLPQSKQINEQDLTYDENGCQYTYNYGETTTLRSIANSYIPFNVVTGVDNNGNPIMSQFDTPALPYLTYGYSIGVPGSLSTMVPQISNLQYDVFSPWNYYTPSIVDPFSVDIPGILFVNYSGSLLTCQSSGQVVLSLDSLLCAFNGKEDTLAQIGTILNNLGSAVTQPVRGVGGRLGIVTTTTSQTGQAQTSSSQTATCPDQNFQNSPHYKMQFSQVVACAQQAGFTGTELEIIVSIANAESGFYPGATYGGSGKCPCGLLQNDQNPVVPNYNPSSCSTGASNWEFNPLCEMQWAQDYIQYFGSNYQNCPGVVQGKKFCYWQTFDDPAVNEFVGAYCQYMPTTYSGAMDGGIGLYTYNGKQYNNCLQGQNGLPWCTEGSPNCGIISGPPSALPSPLSVAVMPNDYIFVLTGTSGAYQLNVLRAIPKGSFTNPQTPTSAIQQVSCNPASESSCTSQWNTAWSNYWGLVANSENGYSYLISQSDLNGFSQLQGFTPFNISVDNNGDVFIVGSTTTSIQTNRGPIQSTHPSLVEITGILTGSPAVTTNTIDKQFQEITVSPSGQQIYLASPSYGSIEVYSGNSLALEDSIDLTFDYNANLPVSNTTASPGIIPGESVSTTLANLNIATYLENGGLYGITPGWIKSALSAVQTQKYQGLAFDTQAFHHPIGIQDVNGYLYVLDNWGGYVGTPGPVPGISGQGVFFNTLLLRVINSSGTNVPFNPTKFNDMYSQRAATCNTPQVSKCGVVPNCNAAVGCSPQISSTCPGSALGVTSARTGEAPTYQYKCVGAGGQPTSTYYTTATPGFYPNDTYPPYGWVLSANVLESGHNSNYVSFCSSESCDYNPNNLKSSYLSLGPNVQAIACFNLPFGIGIGCGVPREAQSSFSVNYNYTADFLFPSQQHINNGCFLNCQTVANDYGELLFAKVSIENYTRLLDGIGLFSCFVDTGVNSNSCKPSSYLDQLAAPIYTVADPFKYLESTGSGRILSYQNLFGSAFTGGGGSPQSQQSQSYNQTCINSLQSGSLNSSSYSSCFSGFTPPTNSELGGITGTSVSIPPGTSVVTSPVSMTSNIIGYVLVPYKYTYSTSQNWQFSGTGVPIQQGASCSNPPSSHSSSSSSEIFSYGIINARSNSLSANVEGGGIYLQFSGPQGSNYYVPNMSDLGSYINPQMIMNIQGDKQFGSIYVNATTGPTTNNQVVLNATDLLEYNIINTVFNTQLGPLSYQTISSLPYGPYNGPAYALVGNQKIATNTRTGISYQNVFNINSALPTFVKLFDWYQQIVYNNPMSFNINSSSFKYGAGSVANVLGYQRLVFVLRDRFGNAIYAPLDTDIANTTSISLQVTPVVNSNNANDTKIFINGTVGYYSPINNKFYPLRNGLIYLYYDTNINYIGYNALQNPSNEKNAMLCAFGDVGSGAQIPSNCVLANPVYLGQTNNANTITYSTAYNSLGECNPPPNSLLVPVDTNCNIYGNDGNKNIPQTCSPGQNGQQRFCQPIFSNGTGTCTSQLGLVGTTTTNSMGFFSNSIYACGIGSATIIARFYGSPSPQPLQASQAWLSSSADPTSKSYTTFNVLNYQWFPNYTQEGVDIGLAELGYGNLGVVILAIALASVLAIYAIRKKYG